ncbi:MAG: hypothetical protein HKL91_05450 [Candidatus Eremiobacteraeota bacterium]|nr:hypothetical protein [Candidatus Eremiobacteraeota bacterium]
MKRSFFLLSAMLALAPSALWAHPSHTLSFSGRLVGIHYQQPSIDVRVGAKTLEVRVTPNTSIQRSGVFATLASLRLGDRVEVLAARSGKMLVAQSISAH